MLEADQLCDRIAIIDHGKIIALDTPRGLRRLLPGESGFELTIDADGADPAHAFAGVAPRVESQAAGDGRWTVRLYGEGNEIAARALEAGTRAGGELVDLKRIEGTLEDVFVHLTGRELR
jgi:ABC-2 type transport system ATP-binding protein